MQAYHPAPRPIACGLSYGVAIVALAGLGVGARARHRVLGVRNPRELDQLVDRDNLGGIPRVARQRQA